VFENGIWRRIYQSEKEEITGAWRNFYDEELHNLYLSLNTIKVMKLKRIWWEEHAQCI
jgi:hypothetical protein